MDRLNKLSAPSKPSAASKKASTSTNFKSNRNYTSTGSRGVSAQGRSKSPNVTQSLAVPRGGLRGVASNNRLVKPKTATSPNRSFSAQRPGSSASHVAIQNKVGSKTPV